MTRPKIHTKYLLQRHFLFQGHRSPRSYEKLEELCLLCVLDLDGFKAFVNLSPVDEIGLDHSYLVVMRLCSGVPQRRNRGPGHRKELPCESGPCKGGVSI